MGPVSRVVSAGRSDKAMTGATREPENLLIREPRPHSLAINNYFSEEL